MRDVVHYTLTQALHDINKAGSLRKNKTDI